MQKVYIDPGRVKDILQEHNVSLSALGNFYDEHYTGWSHRTIQRALSRGWMALDMYTDICKKIDISKAAVKDDIDVMMLKRIVNLEHEVAALRERVAQKW